MPEHLKYTFGGRKSIMKTQSNMLSLSANSKYLINSHFLKKSSKKLASGFRISHAADDAAGLSISEKMRSQIRGLDRAVRNSQEGINLIQTFEGALDEIAEMVRRAKNLAVESSNGSYDDDTDRRAIELEYLHICDEIDHIAETDFNGIVMLTGGKEPEKFKPTVSESPAANPKTSDTRALSAETIASSCSATVKKATAAYASARAGGTVCGDFIVYGDSGNFSFANGVLTIKGSSVTVEGNGKATSNRIFVEKDKSADITIRNVNIDVSSTKEDCAFKIDNNSKGDVTVILEGNNILKSGEKCAGLQKNGGVNTGTLTICGTGSLEAIGGNGNSGCGAGIGGGYSTSSTANIVIKSGKITATGGKECAGIGSGRLGDVSDVTISGGDIDANGGEYGAGIGSGHAGDASGITISGGDIDANGGKYGAGIGGGGNKGNASEITISGGDIDANGGYGGAGIGGGLWGDVSDVTISGGDIDANGGEYGAGIGGGSGGGSATNINIKGGTINAYGGTSGAGIGGGPGGSATSINIEDGKINAEGGNGGAGIGGGYGGGYGGSGKNINITGGVIIAVGKGDASGIGGGQNGVGEVTVDGDNIDVTAKSGNYENYDHIGGKKEDPPTSSLTVGENLEKKEYEEPDKYMTIKSPEPPPPPPPPVEPTEPTKPTEPTDPTEPAKPAVSTRPNMGTAILTFADNLTLQTGARSKDGIEFTFDYSSESIEDLENDLDCTAKGLGMNALTLSDQESANYAIDKLDNALNKVTMIRGTFGSVQNRLEHKISDLSSTNENLTEAESGVRDTDMAFEMLNYTKYNILAQAAQAMQAQTSQLSQSMLELLR